MSATRSTSCARRRSISSGRECVECPIVQTRMAQRMHAAAPRRGGAAARKATAPGARRRGYSPAVRVVVVASINVDLVVAVERLPAAGETIAGGRFARHGGGKGANQAVAAARLGAEGGVVGAVGSDDLGTEALRE